MEYYEIKNVSLKWIFIITFKCKDNKIFAAYHANLNQFN